MGKMGLGRDWEMVVLHYLLSLCLEYDEMMGVGSSGTIHAIDKQPVTVVF